MALYLEYGISSIYRAEGISDITRQQTQNQFPTTNGRVVNVSQGVLSLTLHKRIYTEPAAITILYNEVNSVSAGQIHQQLILKSKINVFSPQNNSASWFSRGTIKTFGLGRQIHGQNNMLSVTARTAWKVLLLQKQQRCYWKNNKGVLLP